MSLEEDLRTRLTAALKARDLRTADVIRMVNTKIMERRTAAGFKGQVDDALVTEVIAAYKKSLEKARGEFAAAGAKGLEHIAALDFEIGFLQGFLPAQLDRAAVTAAVRAAIAELGATDVKAAGRIVGAVMKKHKGEVDSALVKEVAEGLLASQPSS
jgi:uncharacterized protein YqeY